jgi:hypothetical protein
MPKRRADDMFCFWSPVYGCYVSLGRLVTLANVLVVVMSKV